MNIVLINMHTATGKIDNTYALFSISIDWLILIGEWTRVCFCMVCRSSLWFYGR